MNEHSTILLVEDDDGHASLIQRNLKRANVTDEIVNVRDGQQALDYLRNSGPSATGASITPRLLLLDINMPRVDGVEVLRQIKADESTRAIPVVMLTTTDDPREINRCYDIGCNAYVTKPVDYGEFIEVIKSLGLFLQVLSTPSQNRCATLRGES